MSGENEKFNYSNAMTLYGAALSVGYQRMLSHFALHGALLVGLFTLEGNTSKIILALCGLFLAVLTILTMEHFRQIFRLRMIHLLEAEDKLLKVKDIQGISPMVKENAELLILTNNYERNYSKNGITIAIPDSCIGKISHKFSAIAIEKSLSWLIGIIWLGGLVWAVCPACA